MVIKTLESLDDDPGAEGAPLTKDEAIRLVREHSWEEYSSEVTCGHPGCEEHRAQGRRMIHTFSTFGCDIALETAEQYIGEAEAVYWADHLLRHDLRIVGRNKRMLCFDVPRPRREASDA